MVGPNLPFGGLACGLVLGPLPSDSPQEPAKDRVAPLRPIALRRSSQ